MKRFRSDKHRREWDRMEDRSDRKQHSLLDRLEKERPDMAPVKLTGESPNGGVSLTTPLRQPGYWYFGCYAVSWDWIRKEIARKRAERVREEREETARLVGAFI